MSQDQEYEMLGVQVHALTVADVNARIAMCVESGRRAIVANHNFHSAYLYRRSAMMREFYARADWKHIDSMPMVYVGRLLGLPLRREHRVTYIDWVPSLMAEAAARGWRVYYLGSKPGVAEQAAQVLREQHQGLQILTQHGYFDSATESAENEQTVARIRDYRPHVLMVGMGMPRQEHWILANLERLPANAILNCGASFDYIAGVIPTAPRWIGQVGLEWLFRLLCEPRRLANRYLIEPWFLFGPLLHDLRNRRRNLQGGRIK